MRGGPEKAFTSSWDCPLRRWIVMGAFICITGSVSAQEYTSEIIEPQALRLQVNDAYAGILIDGEYEHDSALGNNATATYDRLFMGPEFGLDASGSIYHPNFISFSLDGDISPAYTTAKTHSEFINSSQGSGFAFLGNYSAKMIFLANKPYNVTLYLDQSFNDQQLDFYDNQQVSTITYGASFGYQAGIVPFTINISQEEQHTYGGPYETDSEEESLSLNARNTHPTGTATLNYTYTDYTLSQLSSLGGGPMQSVGIGDTEVFGNQKQDQLTTTAGYGESDYSGGPTNNINASVDLSLIHTPTLSSYYDVNYNREEFNSSDGTENSDSVGGDIALRHQLYDSLTSTLTLQGLDYSSRSNIVDADTPETNSSSQTIQAGGGVTEEYLKHISSTVRLSVTGSVLYERTIQNDTGDTTIQSNESHSFSSETSSFFLNLPDADEGSIIVTDSKGTLPGYEVNIDYTISRDGALTLIRRTATSSIPENSKVLVTYTAASPPSGQYNTLTGDINARVDFWNGLLGVYCRYNSVQNYGASGMFREVTAAQNLGAAELPAAENISDFATGMDGTWRWVHMGAEYESYHSSFASYHSASLNQALTFQPDKVSTLNIDFNESETKYGNASQDEEDLSCITHYRRSFGPGLGFDMESGIDLRRGSEDVRQTLAVVRPGLEFQIGQITVKMGYSYEYSKFLNSSVTETQTLFINAKRAF